MISLLSLVSLALLTEHLATALSIPRHNANYTPSSNELDRRQGASDPASFTWVRRFAAIGDSYTAGIGSGEQLGSLFHNFNDWACSRYDLSYPMMMRQYVGASIENFQYPACTGDQTWQIYNQINALQGNLDLVTLTAGGNDLCLVDIIKDCIVLAFYDEATCNTILAKAEENLANIMRTNIKEMLLALNTKMASDGIVVYNSYAQFFNTDNEKCATDQDWGLFAWVGYTWLGIRSTPLPLTTARRQRFNTLTAGLNNLIRDVVHDVADEVNYKVGFSNWDLWPSEGVDGQMCSPSSSGAYPDKYQPDLLFFKPDTRKTFFRSPIGFKKRDETEIDTYLEVSNGTATAKTTTTTTPNTHPNLISEEEEDPLNDPNIDPVLKSRLLALRASLPKPTSQDDLDPNGIPRHIYRTSLWHSPNPRAAALHALNPRAAPAVPGCPSDSGNSWLPSLGSLLPDFFGRIFHPNPLGHNALASFAIAKTMDLRAEVLNAVPEVCEVTEEFSCWRSGGRSAFVTADRADANMKDFCATVEGPGGGYTNWIRSKVYHEGTPDEMEFILQGGDVDTVNREECLDAFTKVVHGCDAGDSDNPMNWKFGGRWKKGEYSYDLSPRRNRNLLAAPIGQCKGKYKFLFSDFEMYGAGFSSWDYGQDTVLPKSKGCLGLGVTKWNWEYFDQPDANGMEWKVTFRTPVFVSNRCYRNNKVVESVGGNTNGCGGDSGA
ncbi:SGNH hydrolase-type esterase domain-containing protein [Dichotomopilus funicola]|uniref:SGNH hydrolase-type esterase domain-containing protein n=1 Tax=Dichotomopilus funicola TaxID=1934379 RepID=A0AAN6ZMJ6_9PEZI|nr:SGNH hydrolase-type esterase domain-containing protein [Dichotomopilus funicola]